MISDEVGGYHGRALAVLGPWGEGPWIVSACVVCDGLVRRGGDGGWEGGGCAAR